METACLGGGCGDWSKRLGGQCDPVDKRYESSRTGHVYGLLSYIPHRPTALLYSKQIRFLAVSDSILDSAKRNKSPGDVIKRCTNVWLVVLSTQSLG